MERKKIDVRKLTRVGILIAVVVILQLLPIRFGTVEINLALIPIVLGALLYGPMIGAFLGVIDGIVILLLPGTGAFLSFNPICTILMCLLKTGLAGLVAGFLYKSLRKFDETVGVTVAAFSAPIINTGIFMIGVLTIFSGMFEGAAAADGMSLFKFVIVSFITTNFLVEIIVTMLLSPVWIRLVAMYKRKTKTKIPDEE